MRRTLENYTRATVKYERAGRQPGSILQPTILVLEDNSVLLLILSRVLRKAGYRIFATLNAEEALQHFVACQEDIDLVLTDFDMPAMNGLAVIAKLRKLKPDIKVILMSGLLPEETDLEPHHLLQKPFTSEIVLNRLAEVIFEDRCV